MKATVIVTLICSSISFFIAKQSLGQEIANTGANIAENGEAFFSGRPVVWAVQAEHKVRPMDRTQSSNLVWNQNQKKIKIAGAANEHVPFQVIVSAAVPPGRRPKSQGGFFVKTSDLTSADGKIISSEHLKFYLQHYIMLTGKSGPVGATGYWPDALVPLKVPFNMNAQYNVVGNRPLWVDAYIPPSTPAGIYAGTITVTQNDTLVEQLNLEVKVYNFTLPRQTHLITYMNVSKNWLARFYNQPPDAPAIDSLTQKYYDFLYAHRMEPWFNDQLQPEITVKAGKVEVKFNDKRYEYYMNQLGTNRVLFNAYPSALRRQINDSLFSTGFNIKLKSYLSQVVSYFKKNGWQEHLVFNSPIDEPNTEKEYEDTRRWADIVHDAAPGVPFLATESPVTDNEDWGVLTGKVNNFSIHGNALNDPQVKKAILEQQALGGEMTWYISCDQAFPQPNYFIDAPAMDMVMVPWITARYGMEGFLYWAANFWVETVNPWLNANTFISGYLCSDGYILNGEGSVLYPGNFAREYTGQPDVDGPVSSIRFELLRKGIEDYEYLWLLKQKGEHELVEKTLKSMAIDVSAFSRNVEDLYNARKILAERLESLSK